MTLFGDSSQRQACIDRLLSGGWIRRFEWLTEVDSTNSLAKRTMQADPAAELPLLYVADSQTQGRGRGANSWWSPEGCLMFSLVWRSGEPAWIGDRIPQLALVVGLCVAKAIDRFSTVPCQIKWPNDVYLNGLKIAGILVESTLGNGWVIGVGINIRVPIADSDSQEIKNRATSLHYWSTQSVDRESILIETLEILQGELEDWTHDANYIAKRWSERCYLTDRLVEVQYGRERTVGKCIGIDDTGRLILMDSDRQLHAILAGSVRVI